MAVTLQFKRGTKASLPTSGMTAYEPLLATDTAELFVATAATTTTPVVPAISDLDALGTTPASGDFFLIYDIDEGGDIKAKKVVYSDLGVADEKVKVDTGATAGYLGVAAGDGVLRTDSTIAWTDGGDYVTLAVNESNIDHDSLSNYASNEHFTMASITTVGTVTSGTLSTGVVLGGVTMTLGSDADGDMYYRSSNVLTRLPKGTAGELLAMNSGATAPEWIDTVDGGTFT